MQAALNHFMLRSHNYQPALQQTEKPMINASVRSRTGLDYIQLTPRVGVCAGGGREYVKQ